MTRKCLACFTLLIILALGESQASGLVDHQIHVTLNPAEQTLRVSDRIHLPAEAPRKFVLYQGLNPRIITPGAGLTQTGQAAFGSKLQGYRVTLPEGIRDFTLEYGGKIANEFSSRTESPGRSQQLLSGTISSKGVFLDAGVAWYPRFAQALQTFTLTVKLPGDWRAVSQGAGPDERLLDEEREIVWKASTPQDDIYLIAAPYQRYSLADEKIQAQVYLRQADPQLAERYLQATVRYLKLYETLLGPYPYPKFALVENFWETGYGMPSFTLLGSQVIRLPFILYTSYPHEILHNWWGNGVFVDYASGNWSEGLTSYLADHLLKEQNGQGVDYRRTALQRFSNFVSTDKDFPLQAFRARHTSSSQSVGYDKSLMLFHMLRRRLGDENFIAGLQLFYKDNLFRQAGFSDLQQAFEKVSGQGLSDFFQQWTGRTGAPTLALEDLSIVNEGDSYRLTGTLKQTQNEAPFALDIPILIHLESGQTPQLKYIFMRTRSRELNLALPAQPLRIDVDPWFDLFRQLHADETPPTLGRLFGADKVHFILPASAPERLREGYEQMARNWADGYANAKILYDSELDNLPGDSQVWLFGWENRFHTAFLHQLGLANGIDKLNGEAVDPDSQSLVLTGREKTTGLTRGWIGSHNPESLPGLTRKVPHYGKYSYLAFSGERPDIAVKGQWPVSDSPMQIVLSKEPQNIKEVPPPGPLM